MKNRGRQIASSTGAYRGVRSPKDGRAVLRFDMGEHRVVKEAILSYIPGNLIGDLDTVRCR
jgi:hypothetical protein